MANRQPPIIGNRRPNVPPDQAQPPPEPPGQRVPPPNNVNGGQTPAANAGPRVPPPNTANWPQPPAAPPGQRVPPPNNINGAQPQAGLPGQRVPPPNNAGAPPVGPPGQHVPPPNNANGTQPPAAPPAQRVFPPNGAHLPPYPAPIPGQWHPAKPFVPLAESKNGVMPGANLAAATRPPIPYGLDGWQWWKVVEGRMGDQGRPAPFVRKDGNLPPPNAFTMSAQVTNNDLFTHPAVQGLRSWDCIIPGRKAQFAISFARVDNRVASLFIPQSGSTTTPRTPVWECRFGNQAFHNFSWSEGGPIMLHNVFEPLVKDLNKNPVDGGGPLLSVRAEFLGPVPQETRWQLWHLRQPGDAQPLGEQNSRLNGFDAIMRDVNQKGQEFRDSIKDAPKREKEVKNQLIRDGQAAPHVDYDNDQSPAVPPNNAHANVAQPNAGHGAGARELDHALDPLGDLNNPADHRTNGGAANREGKPNEGFDLFNQ